jgi:signal transduction histidine kinase
VSVADILAVDDNASNLLAIEAALAELGGRVISVQSGSEALRLLLDRDFALILLDVKMPSMDGFETARLIRGRKRSSHTPIIFMTAYGRDDAEVCNAYALGAVDFLFKPMLPEVLRAKAHVFVELQARSAEVKRQAEEIREHQMREHERSLREERQRWEAESLRREMQQLAEADQQKDRFLSLLSHELRTPLASLTTGLEVMRTKLTSNGPPPDGALHTRDVMERQVAHLTRLVDDLLDIARIGSGKVGLQKERFALSQIVEDALRTTRPLYDERGHELRVELPPEPVTLFGDPVRLVQVLVNLLNNAARYTPSRGAIELRAARDGDWLEIHVIDNGQGMHADFLPRVFDEFCQEAPQPLGGLGLGLSVVRQLVTLHGGTVGANSAGPGLGSRFTVRLPMVTDSTATTGRDPAAAPDPVREARDPNRPLSIVVIDDSEDVRELMADLLRTWGHTVEVAPDGEAGSELTVRQKPDVAFVDIGLPKLDGYGVAAYVREHLRGEPLRLVAMTGFGQESDRRRALAAGFDIHIVKPASMDALRSALSFEDT